MCRMGKNTAKSRLGVIHSWMLLMHSNVPCILAMPQMTHISHITGKGKGSSTSRLQAMMTAADDMSSSRLVNRNFMRNSNGK